MAFRYRPRPDMDPLTECYRAGWEPVDHVIKDPQQRHPYGESFEIVAIGVKKTGEHFTLEGVGLVSDVSESLEGNRYFLPVPLPDTIQVEIISDQSLFEDED